MAINKDTVYVYNFKKHGGVSKTVGLLLDKVGWEQIFKDNLPVYVKLNLSSANEDTTPFANTDPEVLEAFLEVATSKTKDIFLVESDLARGDKASGLYGGGRAEDMFKLNGIDKMAKRFGVKTMNLSEQEQVYGAGPLWEDFGLPKCLLDEDKVFVTMPLIKTHALTTFTGALKNQWGCIPRWDRILLHKNLDKLIAQINKLIKPDLVLMGGHYGMESRGPTNGLPVEFPVLMGSRKPASADAVAMSLIGLNPKDVRHVKLSDSEVLGSTNLKEIKTVGEFEENKTNFEPATLDWALKLTNDLSRYKFFVYKILQNQKIFAIGKKVVNVLRRVGIVR